MSRFFRKKIIYLIDHNEIEWKLVIRYPTELCPPFYDHDFTVTLISSEKEELECYFSVWPTKCTPKGEERYDWDAIPWQISHEIKQSYLSHAEYELENEFKLERIK